MLQFRAVRKVQKRGVILGSISTRIVWNRHPPVSHNGLIGFRMGNYELEHDWYSAIYKQSDIFADDVTHFLILRLERVPHKVPPYFDILLRSSRPAAGFRSLAGRTVVTEETLPVRKSGFRKVVPRPIIGF
jgi:hypothetical protein